MGNGANFSTAPDMLLFVEDLLRRERFPQAYYDLLFSPSFVGDGHRRSFGWDMTAAKSTFSNWTPTGFSEHAICHTGWTGGAIAVDPDRHFAGVVLGNRLASKEKTMGWAATRSQIFQAKRLEDLASGLWDDLTKGRGQKPGTWRS